MISPDNIPAKQLTRDDGQGAGNSKTASLRTAEQSQKCPRCDSSNTKFCYYNNYSLTQPRHFCKTCRRYWTKGGALRNVPIGGGCRKNKKVHSSSDISRTLNFPHGLSPAMDFQLGGFSFPRLHPPTTGIFNRFSSFGDASGTFAAASGSETNPCFTLDPSRSYNSLMRFNHPLSSTSGGSLFSAAVQNTSSMNIHSGLASSIESLSTVNQDLLWKLQQRRLGTLFGGEIQKDNSVSSFPLENHTQKPQHIVFQNLEISKSYDCSAGDSRKEGTSTGDQTSIEWFFGNSYGPVTTTPTNSAGNAGQGNANSWNGTQAWGDLQQYSAFP